MIFFTSDTHFYHKNIIIYANRPFNNVDEMNNALIENWNSIVKQEDIVYHLGDFSFTQKSRNVELIKKLNGTIHLILGNHDYIKKLPVSDKLVLCGSYKEITIENNLIVLCHFAFRVWNRSHLGSWHLFGHSHGDLKQDESYKSMDVGVDCNNYHPISYYDVKKIMDKKPSIKLNHGSKNLEKDYVKTVDIQS